MKGNITRRGKKSWRLKFDVGIDASGKRQIRYITVQGKRPDAERELTRLLHTHNEGTFVEPSKIKVDEYVRDWLDNADLSAKTIERYRQLAEQQIMPHLGNTTLQKLRPLHVSEWHGKLLTSGGKDGKPLSARTVGHAHRVLHRALARASAVEIVSRNVAAVIKPPKVEACEVEILAPGQITDVLQKLERNKLANRPHQSLPLILVALATGMRRGELLGLQWGDIDLDGASLKVERSVEETKAGLRLKTPKTKNGRRTISLPASAVDALKAHRASQREDRLALRLGRETATTPVFGTPDGHLYSPDNLSRDWRRLVRSHGLPQVMFHALRHTHASALIASGLDVVTISRRLGHSSPNVTLTVYAHLFQKTDTTAASAIEATLRVRTSDP
jgi:integrase